VYHNAGSLLISRHWVAGPISLHVHNNELVGLTGPSGSGKTSVGKALMNVISTWEGEIYWRGQNIRRIPLRKLRGQFGWIGQEPTLAFNPRKRVVDTLRETLAVNGIAGHTRDRISAMCETMNLEPQLAERYPFELSAGQVQRFALIRVFLFEPCFVLLDEPTSSLDPINQAQVLQQILTWRQRHGLAALIIAHSHSLLTRLCDRIVTVEGRS
jgi:peptide/nickel transport system ATP-binding protein